MERVKADCTPRDMGQTLAINSGAVHKTIEAELTGKQAR